MMIVVARFDDVQGRHLILLIEREFVFQIHLVQREKELGIPLPQQENLESLPTCHLVSPLDLRV